MPASGTAVGYDHGVRTVRVLTNETCDHRCGFCDVRRDHERASVAGFEAVVARIDAAAGAEEIVLTGGEPTLRGDLGRLIARARHVAPTVVLETHGAHIDVAAADVLARAGLTIARLHVPGVVAHAAVTGDPRGWDRVCAAASALAGAGVRVEAVIPIVAATLGELDALPRAIAQAMPAVAALRARVIHDAPARDTVAPPAAAIAGFERLADAARGAGLPLQLDPSTFVPPCLLARPDRHAHTYALGPGGSRRIDHHRIAACAACIVADRCPGVPGPWRSHADAASRPLTEERLRRRLSVVGSPEQQSARELVTDEVWRTSDGRSVPARVVRVGFACNQACTFCFVSTHLPAASRQHVERAIDEIAARGGVLVLSGGEPTLDPELLQWVRRGKAGGAREIELQTNATRIDRAAAAALVAAGVDLAFVSLHAATAATSDAITGAPGTFAQTLAGLDALAPVVPRLRINFVFCRPNLAEFPAFVDLVAQRWPTAAITASFVAPSTDLVPHTRALVPSHSEVLAPLVEGLRRARARGIDVGGFESMCGIPLCLVPAEALAPLLRLAEITEGIDRGEFAKGPECSDCGHSRRCYGVRRGYAELYGTAELRPFPAGGGSLDLGEGGA